MHQTSKWRPVQDTGSKLSRKRPEGGNPSVLDAIYPPTNYWPEAPGGGGGGGGGADWGGGGGVREGRLGGGGGGPGGAIWGVVGGGGGGKGSAYFPLPSL